MNLVIEVDGQRKLTQALDTLAKDISDWRPVWEELEQVFYQIEEQQFKEEGRSNTWTPLSAGYARWKKVRYPGKKILERTGELRRSLTGRGGSPIRELTPDSLTLGTSLPYARYHQRGGSRLPSRPPIDITPRDERKFVKEMLRAMQEIGAKDGFGTEYKDIFANDSGVPF